MTRVFTERSLPLIAPILSTNFILSQSWVVATLIILGVLLILSFITLLWYLRLSRQREQALRVSEKRFRALFEQVGDYCMILDPNTADGIPIIVDANRAAYELHGYSREEFIGRPVAVIDDEEGKQRVIEHTKQIMTGRPFFVENTHVRKDGSTFPVAVHANRIDLEGEPSLIFTTEYDITELKQAEQALRESTQQLEAIFDNSLNAIMVTDDLGNYIKVNQAAADMFGYTIEQLLQINVSDLRTTTSPDAWERYQIYLQKGYEIGEFDFIRPDEQTGIAQYHAVRVAENFNLSILSNITERKTAEEALRLNEERLRLSTEMAGVAVWEYDFLENKMSRSANHDLLYGMEPQDIWTIDTFLNATHPDDRGLSSQIIQEAIKPNGPKEYTFDFRVIWPDKSIRWLEVTGQVAERDTNGNGIMVRGCLIDITGRKQAEIALQQSEERFRTIFEQSPIAIQLYDEEGKLIDANQQTLDLFGIEDKHYILGYNMWRSSNFTPESIEAIQNGQSILLEASLDFEWVRELNLFPTSKSGAIYTDLHGAPLIRDGSILGYLIQLVDLTERKEMEAKLLQTQKMESLGRLAGGVAHDFNNILVPIIGYAELAMLNLEPNTKLHTRLQRVKEAANRATRLTHQILAFSRKQIMEMRVLDLNAIIENFEKMLRRLIGEDILLQTFLDPALHTVKADSGQIEQVLMNLAVNARDAMPAGGNLTIETTNVYLDEAYISRYAGAQAPGHHVMLAVSDTGYGMDIKTRQQIFEPFFTTKERGKGTGLGLSTVFGIIKQHGGNIWVYSEPDQGTTFKIYLPKVDDTLPTTLETTTVEPVTMYGSETILVAEDEKMVRQLVCETLAAYGYKVLEAQDAQSALTLTAEHQGNIDLLLTDVIMPEMNGRELHLKINVIDPHIRVLYMSGYTDNVIVHHGMLDEGVNFLQKPFTVQSLIQKVRQIVSKGNQDDGA